MIEIIVITLICYIPICIREAHVAMQLNYMSVTDSNRAGYHKGVWHNAGLTFRIVFHLGLTFALAETIFSCGTLYLLIATGGLGWVIYSPLLDYFRHLPPFQINATCEKWKGSFDWDCITIWIRDHLKINTKIASIIIAVIVIVLMILL